MSLSSHAERAERRISNGLAWRVPAGSRSARPAPSALPAHANSVHDLLRAIPSRSETPTAEADPRATLSMAAEAPDSSGRERAELAPERTLVGRLSTDRSNLARRTTRRRRSPSTGGRRRRHSPEPGAHSRPAFRG